MATFWGDVSSLSSVSSNEQALFTPPQASQSLPPRLLTDERRKIKQMAVHLAIDVIRACNPTMLS